MIREAKSRNASVNGGVAETLTTWYPSFLNSSRPSAAHLVYGGRRYVGKKPRMLTKAISFLII